MTPDVHHPRLRLVRRRAAAGAGLGRLRSEQSEKPPPALLAAGRAARARRRHARAGRHLAGPARAAARRRCRLARRRAVSPTSTPTTPTASTTCAPLFVRKRRRRRRLPRRADVAGRCTPRFGYCFVTPPGSDYPPIVTRAPAGAGRAGDDRRGRAARSTALPILQDHGDIASLGFRFGGVAYSCDLSGMPAESVAALAGLDVWIVDALRYTPHPSHFSVWPRRWPGSSG